jgi:hypothetical protein
MIDRRFIGHAMPPFGVLVEKGRLHLRLSTVNAEGQVKLSGEAVLALT